MKLCLVLFAAAFWAGAANSQNLDERVESSPDPQELQALWDDLRQHPVDLMHASTDEIAILPFFNREIAAEIVRVREQRGGFRSLDEAIAVSGLSEAQKNVLRALTQVRTPRRMQSGISMFSHAQSGRDNGLKPEAWSSRVRAVFSSSDSRAFLFGMRNPDAPELLKETSCGVEIRRPSENARLLLGDYQCDYGTGLIFAAPFGTGDWLASYDALEPTEARGLDLRPSSNRRLTYRGAAARWKNETIDAAFLASWSRRDAALSDSGALRITEGETSASAELSKARDEQLEERLTGAGIQARAGIMQLGVAGYAARFDHALVPDESDALPQLHGRHLNAGSAFMNVRYHGICAVSEIASSDPGGMAYQTALSFRGQNAGFVLYHVRADEDYFSPHSVQWNGFGAAAGNEELTGTRIRALLPHQEFSVDLSTSRTPFRTSASPLRKSGSSLAARWQGALTDESDVTVKLSRRWNEDGSASESWESVVTDAGRVELQWSNVRDAAKLRFELRSAKRETSSDRQLGSLLFLQGKHRAYGIDFAGRLTFFHLESDHVAMQVYEMPLRGEYPLAALSGSGRRSTFTVARDWPHFRPAIKVTQARQTHDGGEQDTWTLGLEFTYRR